MVWYQTAGFDISNLKRTLLEAGKIKQLLQRYLLGRVTTHETTAVDDWYATFDQEALPELSAPEEQQLRMEIWQKVQPQIVVTKTFYQQTWVKVAAMIVVLLGAGLAFYLLQHTSHPIEYTRISTGNRERKTLHLADGTVLTLNAGSTLLIAKDLSKERRLQLVDGEVFFNVGTDTRRPFIVESGPLVTTVLGTSFNIAAYQALHQLSVAVVSGKVSVTGKGNNILEKGQSLIYDRTKGSSTLQALDTTLLQWQQGRLVLNDVTFDEMTVLIEKNFGVHISTATPQVKQNRYTTELNTDMEPAQAIEVLAAIHGLKIKHVNNQIILY